MKPVRHIPKRIERILGLGVTDIFHAGTGVPGHCPGPLVSPSLMEDGYSAALLALVSLIPNYDFV